MDGYASAEFKKENAGARAGLVIAGRGEQPLARLWRQGNPSGPRNKCAVTSWRWWRATRLGVNQIQCSPIFLNLFRV